jgi:DNA-binding Lrp family transcriptional regulator
MAIWGNISRMDVIDRKILAQLQVDGRLTVTELADRVGLSLSPCHRRVRSLEEAGVIRDYRARLDAAALGLNFRAIVFATLREGDRTAVQAFEAAVSALPEVIQAQRLFGDPDYILHVVCADLDAFQKLYDDRLSALPKVQRLTSTLVMKSVVEDRLLPLSGAAATVWATHSKTE